MENIIDEIKYFSYGMVTANYIEISNQIDSIHTEIFIDELQIYITGKTINVIAVTKNGRELANLERFIAEPSS